MATSQQINDFIASVLGNKKSQQEQAAEINAAANQYGVSRDQIAQATGYGLDAVKQFLGPNTIGQQSAATPYQIYDKPSDTYRYVDATGYENWQRGIPLAPINTIQGSPVYYGAPPQQGGLSAEGSDPGYAATMPRDDSFDIQELQPQPFNRETFNQAYANQLYAPEGLIANEVVNRAAWEMPETFDPRNLALQKERDAMMGNATSQFLNDVMSVDQITGDVDSIQSLRNIAAYDPTLLRAVPGIRGLPSTISNLSPVSYEAVRGISGPYGNDLSPEDIRSIRAFGPEYQTLFNAIGDVLESGVGSATNVNSTSRGLLDQFNRSGGGG